MSMADVFSSIAEGFSDAMGGPFHDALALWPGEPVKDAGGAIISPGTPTETPCSVQVDKVTELMRRDPEYRDKDVRLIVINIANIDTDARIQIATGDHAGTWMIQSVERDPAAIGFDCRGRRA